jgi:hypothetical protein
MNRIVTFAGCTAAVVALAIGCAGAAAAATTPATQGPQEQPGMYSIEMDLSNNSAMPLTLFSASHDYAGKNTGDWQQRAPQSIAAYGSAVVTAYTDDPSGFEATLDYLTPDGHAVLFQAVNYVGKATNTGDSETDDPALTLTADAGHGMFATYSYFLQ